MVTQYGAFHSPADSPLGLIRLTWVEGALVALDFDAPPSGYAGDLDAHPAEQTLAWLAAYFAAERLGNRPEIKPAGTAFQQRVWSALLDIPWGESMTYAELARRVGSAPRAVGGALRANPIPILIPCHRVVAVSALGGYAGASALGQARKRWLLRHEGVSIA